MNGCIRYTQFVRPGWSNCYKNVSGVLVADSTPSLQVLGQFLANFPVLSSRNELHWVLAVLSKPLANRVDVQLITTDGYRTRPR
jgi:hypothetical protein